MVVCQAEFFKLTPMRRPEDARFLDPRSAASDPGRLTFSPAMFRRLQPDTQGLSGLVWRITGVLEEAILREHLDLGDSRAALVMSLSPLVVAAYTDELDCVALLGFPDFLVAEHRLTRRARLLTVNTYRPGWRVAMDLVPGPASTERYVNFRPIIGDFVSEDRERLERRKAAIPEPEWQRCAERAEAHYRVLGQRVRDGSPLRCEEPAPPVP